jgi:hypothetical protein
MGSVAVAMRKEFFFIPFPLQKNSVTISMIIKKKIYYTPFGSLGNSPSVGKTHRMRQRADALTFARCSVPIEHL